MCLYSLPKTASFGFGQTQQQGNESTSAGRAITRMFLHHILYFMTCLCVRLWRGVCLMFAVYLRYRAGVYVRVCVCASMQIEY